MKCNLQTRFYSIGSRYGSLPEAVLGGGGTGLAGSVPGKEAGESDGRAPPNGCGGNCGRAGVAGAGITPRGPEKGVIGRGMATFGGSGAPIEGAAGTGTDEG